MTKKLNISEFIRKSNKFHKNKYNYHKSIYKNAKTKLIITCKIHGDFLQTPDSHYKKGCIKCAGTNKKTNKEFILESKNIYKDRFLYDKTNYISAHKKVIITCKIHGDFLQTPSHFLNGITCQGCFIISKGESLISKYLDTNNYIYVKQKYYKFLGNKLYFDFYIKSKKIYIEYDGEQHFLNKKFGNKYSAIENHNRDIIKNNYICSKNKTLFRIHYKDIRNINKLLNEFLNKTHKPNIYYSRTNYYKSFSDTS